MENVMNITSIFAPKVIMLVAASSLLAQVHSFFEKTGVFEKLNQGFILFDMIGYCMICLFPLFWFLMIFPIIIFHWNLEILKNSELSTSIDFAVSITLEMLILNVIAKIINKKGAKQ